MKTFKKLSSAQRAANGAPIIMLSGGGERLFVVIGDVDTLRFTEVSLLTAQGAFAGHATMRTLDRLGNANWAVAREEYSGSNRPRVFAD